MLSGVYEVLSMLSTLLDCFWHSAIWTVIHESEVNASASRWIIYGRGGEVYCRRQTANLSRREKLMQPISEPRTVVTNQSYLNRRIDNTVELVGAGAPYG